MITLGLGLQAFGIVLEAIGLGLAFRSFGSAYKRAIREDETYRLQRVGKYRKEGKQFAIQGGLILVGLACQFVGLFV